MSVKRVQHATVPNLPDGLEVAVGFFPGAKYQDGTPVAQVAAVHEFGLGVPARSFMRPTIAEHAGPRWGQAVLQALKSGKTLDQAAHTLGNFARGDMQQAIAALTSPPLAEETLHARRTRKSPPPNNSTKPLVDTRIMMPSLQYTVRQKQ